MNKKMKQGKSMGSALGLGAITFIKWLVREGLTDKVVLAGAAGVGGKSEGVSFVYVWSRTF